MITLDENIRAIVFAGFSDDADYLAGISANPDGPGFVLKSRLRFHTQHPTGDPFRDDDRKAWYTATIRKPLDEAVATVKELALALCEHAHWAGHLTGPAQVFVLERGPASLELFVKKLESMPFAYKATAH